MSLRLICGDRRDVRLERPHIGKMMLFRNHPELAFARSYTLKCGASSDVVNLFLDRVSDESEEVTITKNNYTELAGLCRELGFSGLDDELHKFEISESIRILQERLDDMCRQNMAILKLVSALQDTCQEQFRLLRDTDQRLEQRTSEALQKAEEALSECAKQSDVKTLVRDVEELKIQQKKHESEIQVLEKVPKEFSYDERKPLEGLIAHLTRKCGGNVHDKSIVEVKASSVWNSLENAVDLETNSYFCSSNTPNSWICYDFNAWRVIPRSYSIRSRFDNPGGKHPKSWVFQVSNDKVSWRDIDLRENTDDLNGKHVTQNFKITKQLSEGFQFLRLKQTAKNHSGDYHLSFSALEIFGILQGEESRGEFVYDESRPLQGVIAHLTRECGGNVHRKRIVNVTASGDGNEGFYPRNLADLESGSFFLSGDEENMWVCYDFKKRRVIPKSYSMKSSGGLGVWPKSWVFEVSMDGRSWTEVDRRADNNDLKVSTTKNFKILPVPKESFRFVRVRQTGKNHIEEYFSILNALEVFGTLYDG